MISKTGCQSQPRKYSIRVISGQQLLKQKSKFYGKTIDPYVRVNIAGEERDRFQFETDWVPNNGFNPRWNDTTEVIVQNPEAAMIRFSVWNKHDAASSDYLGQYSLPLSCCQRGYRHISLEDENGKSLRPASVFVHLDFKFLSKKECGENVLDRTRTQKQNIEKMSKLGQYLILTGDFPV